MAVSGGSPQNFLFCNFRVNQGKVVMLDTVISHDFYLKLFLTALDKVDLPRDDFSFHSVKSGAFSEARNSGKVSLSVLERHSRWVARKMVDRSLEVNLQATRALRINQ